MLLTSADLETFQAQHPNHRLELVNGNVIIMSPSGYESDEVAAEVIAQLRNWVRPRRLGRLTWRIERAKQSSPSPPQAAIRSAGV